MGFLQWSWAEVQRAWWPTTVPTPRGRAWTPTVEPLEVRTLLAAAFPEFIDPHPAPDNQFGAQVVPLSTGNVVITAPYDDAGGTDAGAVYLFNGTTGALISTLIGSTPGDQISNYGVTALTNGNFVVSSPYWDNGAAADAGAVTWGSGTTGVSGVVSDANSLVGSTAGDQIGSAIDHDAVMALSNGNYVVRSRYWDNGAAINAGAVTFGNGTTGVSGVVSAANSLVGTSANDSVGVDQVWELSNGNYLVPNPSWDNGTAINAGAVTFGNGMTGVSGAVSVANSFVGTSANDAVGNYDRIVVLSNGNYLVLNPSWDNGAATDVGAITFGNGTTGVTGTASAVNSLVGTSVDDRIGLDFYAVTELSNGNYVVCSPDWDNETVRNTGAVTFGNGTTGITGPVSAANSLVGSSTNDRVGYDRYVGSAVTALSNGNYVVRCAEWDHAGARDAGAVTFGNGTTGVTGPVSAANSLVGVSYDFVGSGGVTALSNGNYVVSSPAWDNGTGSYLGAVTFGNGTTGITGAVSAANSLVGTSHDEIGSGGVTALSNGNYVVCSPGWNNGTAWSAGAVTFGNGTTGTTGEVSAANSLVGTSVNDSVGMIGYNGLSAVTVLSNGNYVVSSRFWDNGTAADAGAVTFGNGTTGVTGAVSAANSLVGTSTNDYVGYIGYVRSYRYDDIDFSGVTALSNGNYVVRSCYWDNGTAKDAGAVTFGNGMTGVAGTVSAANSLVGTSASDFLGSSFPLGFIGPSGLTELSNGNYVVSSPAWDNGTAQDAGAVTFGNGTTGITGAVSAANSLVGSSTNDYVGSEHYTIYEGMSATTNFHVSVTALSNGNYVVSNPHWDNGTARDAGAITFGNGTTGISGVMSAVNSLIGSTTNDRLGYDYYSVRALSNGNYVVSSPGWDNGVVMNTGAATFGDGTMGVSGTINETNSLLGTSANTGLAGFAILDNPNGAFYNLFLTDGSGRVVAGSQTSGFANVVPTIGGSLANQPVNDNATLAPFATVTVADSDTQSQSVGVTITNGVDRGDFTAASTIGWTRTVSGNDILYERLFPAEQNSGEAVQMAIRTLVFQPRANVLPVGTTETTAFTLNVDDGSAPVVSDTNTTVISTSVNDAPTLSSLQAGQTVNDNATLSPFSALTITDPDPQNMFARVTIFNGVFRGDFAAATTAGWTRTVTGNNIVYTRYYNPQSASGSMVEADLRVFVFQPRSNAIKPNVTELTDITVFVNDGLANTTATTRLATTSLNDAPLIGGLANALSVNDDANVIPFSNLAVTDPDTQGMFISVTILNGVNRGDFTNATSANGWTVRQVLGNNITYKRYFSPQVNVGAAAQAAFRALIFQPRQNAIKPGTTELTDFQVTVSDGVALAVANAGTRVTTTSVNNATTITGAVSNQTMDDNQAKAVFSMMTVADPDTQDLFVRITITSGTTRGDFTAASTAGWMRKTSGGNILYERFFVAAANNGGVVQAAIRALVFQPRTNVPVGTTETTSFTVFVNDGLANVTNSTTSVITTGVAPRLAHIPAAMFLDQDTSNIVLPTITKSRSNPLARLLKKSRT